MGLITFKGNYCLKCQSPRDEAIGIAPRCEKCGSDLRHVEVSHTGALFAGYLFLGLLILLVIGVVISTLVMAWVAIAVLAALSVVVGVLAIICILLNRSLMKGKIAKHAAGAG